MTKPLEKDKNAFVNHFANESLLRLISLRLISSRLISSRLISSRLISSKRPIDSTMLMLWPWQLNLTDNALKLIDKLIELLRSKRRPFCNTFSRPILSKRQPFCTTFLNVFDEIVVKFKFKFNAMKLLENKNVFVNDFVNKPPKLKFKVMKLVENKSVVLSWVYLQPFWGYLTNTNAFPDPKNGNGRKKATAKKRQRPKFHSLHW